MTYMRLSLVCAAMVALAAYAAPTVSASPVLTQGGVAVAVGTSITAKNTSTAALTTVFGCSTVHFRGTVAANTGTQFKGEVPGGLALFTSTGASGDCTSLSGDARITVNSNLCFESVKGTHNVTFTGCGGGSVTFTATFTQGFVCKYKATSVTGAFVTNANATTNITEQPVALEEGGFLCPSSSKLDVHLDWYATDGTVLTIS